jgi:hypothetical protein
MANRVVVIAITRKLRGQIPAIMRERVIQERLGWQSRPECQARFGHRGSNPKRFSSSWQVCLTCSDGLLIGYKVARQFESHPLRHRVWLLR